MGGHFLEPEMDHGQGLEKDPEGLTPIERQIRQPDSVGVNSFKEGIRMTNTQRDATKSALNAWKSYESFS